MRDTKPQELIGEYHASSIMMSNGIIIAKPNADRKGTDLLGFLEIDDHVKFCRIQCKFRTLRKKKTQIKILPDYISNAFVLTLTFPFQSSLLSVVFLKKDILAWNDSTLSVCLDDVDKLRDKYLLESRIEEIKRIIRESNAAEEIAHIWKFQPSKYVYEDDKTKIRIESGNTILTQKSTEVESVAPPPVGNAEESDYDSETSIWSTKK